MALSFDSLPSSQGWTLDNFGPHGDDSEATLFNVSNGSLFQTTVGTGQNSGTPGSATYLYDIPSSFGTADTVSLFFTTAVTEHEQTRQDLSFGAHRFSIVFGGQTVYVGIKPGELSAMRSYFTPLDFDGSVDNSYRLTLDSADDSYEFYLNDELVDSGASEASGLADGLFIMDGTGTANANAEVSQLIAVTGTVIPEPGSFALLLGVVSLAQIFGRRRVKLQ